MGVKIQNSLHIGTFPALGIVLDLFLDVGLAQRNADDTVEVVGDDTLAPGQFAGLVGIGDQKLGGAAGGIAQDRARNGAVIGDAVAVFVASRGQVQLAALVPQEDKAALRVGQP